MQIHTIGQQLAAHSRELRANLDQLRLLDQEPGQPDPPYIVSDPRQTHRFGSICFRQAWGNAPDHVYCTLVQEEGPLRYWSVIVEEAGTACGDAWFTATTPPAGSVKQNVAPLPALFLTVMHPP